MGGGGDMPQECDPCHQHLLQHVTHCFAKAATRLVFPLPGAPTTTMGSESDWNPVLQWRCRDSIKSWAGRTPARQAQGWGKTK